MKILLLTIDSKLDKLALKFEEAAKSGLMEALNELNVAEIDARNRFLDGIANNFARRSLENTGRLSSKWSS